MSLRAVVLTVDQRSSRSSRDAVPEALTLLADLPVLRPVERTAGDEFQVVIDSPDVTTSAIGALLRDGRWHIGVGVGGVEHPLPPSTRAGRGDAYLAAREAVEAAGGSAHHVEVRGDNAWCRHLESALWWWAGLLGRRTAKGWEVVDLVTQGLTFEAAGQRLGISQSAVSQRVAAAQLTEERRARELVTALAALALHPSDSQEEAP